MKLKQANNDLSSMFQRLILPYVRAADFSVRNARDRGERRLFDFLLIYFDQGSCVLNVEGIEYEFTKGDFCLIQPGDSHNLDALTNIITPFIRLDFFYNPERASNYPNYPSKRGTADLARFEHLKQPRLNSFEGIDIPVKFSPTNHVLFREAMLRIIGIWQEQDYIKQLEVQHLATQLLLELLKDYCHPPRQNTIPAQSLDAIPEFLNSHLAEPVTVDDMAKTVNLSPSRFAHAFHERFGQSPYQYLLQLRIKHAQELLESSTFSIQQIAEFCGFANVQHFSKSFKRSLGVSPGIYRNLKSNVRILMTVPMTDFDKILANLDEFHAELYATLID